MNLLRGAAKFVGWLTAILAGITAIIYACGYFVVRAQLYLLGIDILLPSGREYYLQKGANFLIETGQEIGFYILGIILFALFICIPWSIMERSNKGANYLAGIKKKLLGVQEKYLILWQGAILIAMVILLYYPLLYNLDVFRAPNLLSITTIEEGSEPSPNQHATNILNLLKNDNTDDLDELYSDLIIHCLFAGFLMAMTLRITSTWPLKFVLTFPFFLVFIVYLFLLPSNFAILKKRIAFPAITIRTTFDKDESPSNSEDILLLNKTGQEFILWDRKKEKAIWIPLDKAVIVEVGQVKPVLK